MDLSFSEEQELLHRTAREFLAEHATPKRAREVMEGPDAYSAELWRRIAELGWTGLALPESYGGSGLGLLELVIVAENLGRVLAPVPFLPTAIAAGLLLEAGSQEQCARWLPGIARGAALASLALAGESGSEELEEVQLAARRSAGGWRLDGVKGFVPDAAASDLLVVVARGEAGLALFAVPRDTPGVAVEALKSIDRLRPVYAVRFRDAALPAAARLGDGGDAGPRLERALDRARVVTCAEMLGAAEKCLEDAVAYARQRTQFGRPIGAYQAIKHACADMLLDVEASRSITYYAAWAVDGGEAEAPLAAAMAKAYVGEAFRRTAAANIQIHGGAGFTWEADCHLYFKRATSDDLWLGDGRCHRERVARMLEAGS